MKKIYIVFVLCLLLLGCVTTSTLKFDPRALDGQNAISKDGVEAVVSQKKARVTIQPSAATYTSKDLPTIVVSVYGGEEEYDFSTEDVQVFVDGTPHGIVPYDELVEELKKEERKALNKLDMEQDNRMRGTGANPEAVKYAEEQYQIGIQDIKGETARSIRILDSTMLKKKTVSPREEYSGKVMIEKIPDPSKPHEVKVIVTAAGEKHEFILDHLSVK